MFKIEKPHLENLVSNKFDSSTETYSFSSFQSLSFPKLDFSVDFNHCSFSDVDFSDLHLNGYIFTDCYFDNCDFSNAFFDECGFHRCTFESSKLLARPG